jgi:pyruvate-formate lyase-activating enzyme
MAALRSGPGLTKDSADIGEITRFAAGVGAARRIDVLPFHLLGRNKSNELSMRYELRDTNHHRRKQSKQRAPYSEKLGSTLGSHPVPAVVICS